MIKENSSCHVTGNSISKVMKEGRRACLEPMILYLEVEKDFIQWLLVEIIWTEKQRHLKKQAPIQRTAAREKTFDT
ncbi:hypothetical protein [Calidifontibacillus erzurumensis]|uniref:Uncharacterized protein n=1 Tax=Calidifontibacillus erzurumensis TaxID=2741433 RepID=A0A8J8GFA8_9BACI|nr:hypothetical protein [Calidifontibacillus erzurumensis]NSL52106.1 hypothetical protein [Calidifontibacillus erzurumensis]